MKQIFLKPKYLIIALILSTVIFFSFKIFDDNDDFNIAKNLEIYHSVIRDVRLYYVDEVNLSRLIEESIEELLNKLDPYTVYYPESDVEKYTFMTTGAYGGIGATISDNSEELVIREIYKNSPSLKSGLITGDKIISINGNIVKKNNIKELKELIKGEPGSELKLKIERYNIPDYIDINIIRDKIQVNNIVFSGILREQIGYIKMGAFKINSAKEFKQTLLKLRDSVELRGLIVDLRDNPGGLLKEAVSIVNLFVDKDEIVVSTKGKVNNWNTDFKTTAEPVAPNLPLVILVNNSSASASEIVAGAIQDLDRGVVVGNRTYGKGLVQVTRDLVYNTKIKITTAKYYIPSGRCIQIIDYSHRNPDGSVGNVPDSLISEFSTKGGRKVYDGGGILPDINVNLKSNSSLIKNLIHRKIIFDYCTKFYFENKTIKSPKEFILSDSIYNDFVAYLKTEKFTYNNDLDEKFENLITAAKYEEYSEADIEKIINLKKEFSPNFDKELEKYKKEIKELLESEIILRYYFYEEMFSYEIKNDPAIKQSKYILTDKIKYNEILGK